MRPLLPAAAAAAVLVLAACSEPEPGSPLPTGAGAGPSAVTGAAPSTGSPGPSASPTTSGTTPPRTATSATEPQPTPTAAPTLPPEATTNDAAGAEAFVKYWFDVVNFAYDTLEAEPMLVVSSSDCDVCTQIEEEVDEYRAQDARVVGGTFRLSEATAPTPDDTGVIVVAVAYSQEAYRVVDAAGVDRMIDGESASLGAVLRWEDEQWHMYGLGV